jgi:hypothetical protein
VTKMVLTEVDKEALDRALVLVKQRRIVPEKITESVVWLLQDSSWLDAATYAAFHCQFWSLGLQPWQDTPCYADPTDDPAAWQLQQRLLRLGLSKFEPSPIEALERKGAT